MNDTTTSNEAGFYKHGGRRKGLVSADKLRELLTATIDEKTPGWRIVLTDVQPPLNGTDLGAYRQNTLRATAASRAQHLRHTPTYGFVWIAPLIVSISLGAA